jgi:hypothetical protein
MVLDPFCGTGTTGLAALQLGRQAGNRKRHVAPGRWHAAADAWHAAAASSGKPHNLCSHPPKRRGAAYDHRPAPGPGRTQRRARLRVTDRQEVRVVLPDEPLKLTRQPRGYSCASYSRREPGRGP